MKRITSYWLVNALIMNITFRKTEFIEQTIESRFMPPIGFPSSLAPPTAPLFARGSILIFSQYFKSLLLAKKNFFCCIVRQKINNGSHFSSFRRELGTCKSQLFNFINSSCFFHTSYVSRNRKLHDFFLCQDFSCARHIFVWKWLRL